MNGIRLFTLPICAGILMASLCHGPALCLAQTAAPLDIPASLRVPNRFERAVKNQSSGPSYLIATIVNDTTGERKLVCIEGIQLYAGVRKENKLGRDDWDKVFRLILGSTSRTYHFTSPDAWAEVQPRYTPEKLATVQEELRLISTTELAARFSYARTNGLVKVDKTVPIEEFYSYLAAMAYVLTERGLLAGRGDFGNSLYVITPQILAEEESQKQRYAEEGRKNDAEGKAFAARLPGYSALTKRYTTSHARLSDWLAGGFCFSVSVNAASPHMVDSLYWLNPVNEKTRKARYDWNQFLAIAEQVKRLARQHPWLQNWKSVGPNRTVEAQIYGTSPHNETFAEDFEEDIVPAWKDAGLKGKPYCQLELRSREKGKQGVADVYLPQPGSGETRSLIVSSSLLGDVASVAPTLHWLDRLSFRSSAGDRVRQAVVVTPGGDWKLLTLPTRRKDKKLRLNQSSAQSYSNCLLTDKLNGEV